MDWSLERFRNKIIHVDDLLKFCTDNHCSDLYLKVGNKPYISRYGLLYEIPSFELTTKIWQEWAKFAISSENNAKYVRQKMLDFSYSIPTDQEEYRYRVSAGFSMGKNIATFRMISLELPSFSKINFPSNVQKILTETSGKRNKITMFCGVTGCGKSIHAQQKLNIKRNGESLTILWRDLAYGDIFDDGSHVEWIAPWETRKCYCLQTNNQQVVVSDEHLIHCLVDGKMPEVDYGGEQLWGWSSAMHLYWKFQMGSKISLLGSHENLISIEPWNGGLPQLCRCIRTNTGQYRIGDFIHHNTTTMASCINDFTQNGGPLSHSVMVCLEDPIEYQYKNKPTVNIIQKELGTDFKSFSLGIKQALREHPNFVHVGEARDRETIKALVEASRTGPGVFTSFHSNSVADTISRLYNHLAQDHDDVMYDLISNINLILCQRLVPNENGFQLDTQYLLFVDQVTQYLIDQLERGKNIPKAIDSLMKREELIQYNIIKDWEHGNDKKIV